MTYERTVAAAVTETTSKFELAEALAEDIPPRRSGPTDETKIPEFLADARQAIIDAGGEPKSLETLKHYRETALWVRFPGEPNQYRWAEGASFTAHRRAWSTGMSYADFMNMPIKTGDAVHEAVGRSAIRGTSAVKSWSQEQRAEVARELLNDPDVAEQVVSDKETRATVSQATDDYYRQQAQERAERTERMAAEDQTDRRIDSVLWVNRLGEAHERYAREVNEALRHVGELPETERYWLTGAVDRAESSMRASRRYLELGKSEFEAELEDLLQNGA